MSKVNFILDSISPMNILIKLSMNDCSVTCSSGFSLASFDELPFPTPVVSDGDVFVTAL